MTTGLVKAEESEEDVLMEGEKERDGTSLRGPKSFLTSFFFNLRKTM